MKVKNISQSSEAARAAIPRPAKPQRHRILVVEDDGDIRQLNTEALTQCGYHVDAAQDGAAAWDALQLNGYDLMVTDNDMPKVTGVDLLKKLHAARLAVPVIMATGTLPREEFIRHPWLQPAAMLIKPYTIDELVGTVHEVLRVTDGSSGQIVPPPSWQNQQPSEGWQL
jgi:DNA-binding response OmpR family regulator